MRYQRELTALVLIPVVLGVVIAGPVWAFSLLVAIAAGLALLEFYGMLLGAGLAIPRLCGFLLFFSLLAAAFTRSAPGLMAASGAVILLLPALVMFSSPPEPLLLPSSAAAVFATLYVGIGAASFIGLRALSWKPVILLLAIVWAGDSAAYYTGRKWGKRKMAPVVSPKKTWEGFWGQMAGGTAIAAVTTAAFSGAGRAGIGAGIGALIGFGLSGVAVVGDLVESTFKRSCSVKDSGALLPGHGGLLDRLDSLLYSGPFLLALLELLPGDILR